MKTLRRMVAVGLLVGSVSSVLAQSNSVPKFKSEAEKQAWYDAQEASEPKFKSDDEKEAWIKAKAERSGATNTSVTTERTAELKQASRTVQVRTDAKRMNANVKVDAVNVPVERVRKQSNVTSE